MQTSKKFAEGWRRLFDVFHNIMRHGLLPTVTLMKQKLEHDFSRFAQEGNNEIIEYLREGGK